MPGLYPVVAVIAALVACAGADVEKPAGGRDAVGGQSSQQRSPDLSWSGEQAMLDSTQLIKEGGLIERTQH
jgi:hypothetical protein